jgi:hypothetical protein
MKLRKPSILVVNWVSFCLSFFLSASTATTCIFPAPNCTITIISLEPRALNAKYQHFILSSSISCWDFKKCLYFVDTTERGDMGWKEAPKTGWRQGYFTDDSSVSVEIFCELFVNWQVFKSWIWGVHVLVVIYWRFWTSNFLKFLFSSISIPFVLIGCISNKHIQKWITNLMCTLIRSLLLTCLNFLTCKY